MSEFHPLKFYFSFIQWKFRLAKATDLQELKKLMIFNCNLITIING